MHFVPITIMFHSNGHSTVISTITETVWLCAYRGCWYSITVTVWLCACTALPVQHYSNCVTVCMYSTAGIALQVLCACTALLVQHSLTVVTTNSSLTQCTVGADRMFTYVYATACQLSTVHIVTHSAISNQQTCPNLNTLYRNQQ